MAVNIKRSTEEVEITSLATSTAKSVNRVTVFPENGLLFLAGWSGDRCAYGLSMSKEDAITFGAALEELGRQ